jgi:hypothetical protein
VKENQENRDPFPTCTNIRYNNTDQKLCVDLNDLNHTKCGGYVRIYANEALIHQLDFKSLWDIPIGYAIDYIPKQENEIIEVKLALGKKIVRSKVILNEDSIRNPISWEEWEKGKK